MDGSGNVYVTGNSSATWGTPLHAHSGDSEASDIFVLKLDSGGAYQWHTFYGQHHDTRAAMALPWTAAATSMSRETLFIPGDLLSMLHCGGASDAFLC